MAGAKDNVFKEKLTSYIEEQMKNIISTFGSESKEYKAFELQYIKSKHEEEVSDSDRMRHYQSDMHIVFDGMKLTGVERLYKRTILIEPSSVCAAHCRWCLRGQYPLFTLRDEEITQFAKYCGSELLSKELREILITGGDPFMVPKKLRLIIEEIKKYAQNIEIIRIGTRVPVQDPARVNADLIDVLKLTKPLKLEIATHINHPIELSNESIKAYQELYNHVFKIYDQTVLLKGVNDDFDTLCELYDSLRYLGIEAHYLFHCIPMLGMSHHRTSVQKGLDLIARLTSSGYFSGRAKPLYTLMTDIGKISLYHGSIIEKNANNELLIQSSYTVKDFLARNPFWKLPDSCVEDKNGLLRVWYPDGEDD
jgi:lysine 2,3-aminomutase